ncbi:MAG: diguanylate cyclase [Candidatus Sedimenticola sp. 6PFRAG7]
MNGASETTLMERLLKLLEATGRSDPGESVPDIDLDDLPGNQRQLAVKVLDLIESRNEACSRYRKSMAMLLADADALGETLGHIGLGDFSISVAEVKLPGLDTIRIGIEDMARQLRESQETLNDMLIELRQSEEKFRNLVESSSDWIWEVDRDGIYRYASPQVESILGYRPDEIIGRTPFDLMPSGEAEKITAAFNTLKSNGAPINRLENIILHKDGRRVILETNGVAFWDENGELAGYRGVDRDITERKRIEEKLKHLATHDTLTKLYNRQAFLQHIHEEVQRAQRYKSNLSVLLMDIDHFKLVNDTFGHSAGDEVLSRFAGILEGSLRKTDFVARYGGEEFIAILPETAITEARELAERLRVQIAEHPFKINDHKTLNLSVSIGIASFPEHARSGQELIDAADSAMYAAKKAGRNQVVAL